MCHPTPHLKQACSRLFSFSSHLGNYLCLVSRSAWFLPHLLRATPIPGQDRWHRAHMHETLNPCCVALGWPGVFPCDTTKVEEDILMSTCQPDTPTVIVSEKKSPSVCVCVFVLYLCCSGFLCVTPRFWAKITFLQSTGRVNTSYLSSLLVSLSVSLSVFPQNLLPIFWQDVYIQWSVRLNTHTHTCGVNISRVASRQCF